MKFKFPLQKVLDHRKVKEDLAQKDFQEALMVLNDIKAKLTELENATHEAHLRVGILQKQGGAQGPALSQINDFLRNQKILIQMQQVKIFNQEKVVEEKRILLTQAAVETKIISKFKEKKFDVLVATTIIENGLDIKNANTLIVDDATRLGLAQAYQIRGRIGRAEHKAHAYFLYPSKVLSEDAKKRLEALQEATELGSGYFIAQRDLEIRGAGNILGKKQSGAVNAIGLNLYCQILNEAVEKLSIEVQPR